jgi:hypothetical protein
MPQTDEWVLSGIRFSEQGPARLSCEVRRPEREPFVLWFEFPLEFRAFSSPSSYDPFLAAALLPAMIAGCDIRVEGACSRMLLASARGPIQAQLLSWFPEGPFEKINIISEESDPSPLKDTNRKGCFFSGGVDSLYAVIRQAEVTELRLTDLITVHGFDIPLRDRELFRQALANCRRAASDNHMALIEASTNVREFMDKFGSWGMMHGAAMAAVGLSLSAGFSDFLIPSGSGPQTPWGSHPDFDPLWSNGRARFVHDIAGIPRRDKIAYIISRDKQVLTYLRCCWENREGLYNCSSCEKCLRTMMGLYLAGVQKDAVTFDWKHLHRSLLFLRTKPTTHHHWRAIRAKLPMSPKGLVLKTAITLMFFRSSVHQLRKRLRGEKAGIV